MKTMYCWRCGVEVPMLDEQEFASVAHLYRECMRATKEFRQKHGLPLTGLGVDERFQPLLDAYEQLTGYRELHQNAIMHHRISLYAPACPRCTKPLRSAEARRCAACGYEKEDGG